MDRKKINNLDIKVPGHRMTRQRRIILEELRVPGRHLTADEVYTRLRKRKPDISLGTVYRNLELLTQAGEIKKLSIGSGPKQYDGGMHKHYHIRCKKCGKFSDVPADAFGDLDAIAAAGDILGFDIIDHELEFTGLCDKCRKPEPISSSGKE